MERGALARLVRRCRRQPGRIGTGRGGGPRRRAARLCGMPSVVGRRHDDPRDATRAGARLRDGLRHAPHPHARSRTGLPGTGSLAMARARAYPGPLQRHARREPARVSRPSPAASDGSPQGGDRIRGPGHRTRGDHRGALAGRRGRCRPEVVRRRAASPAATARARRRAAPGRGQGVAERQGVLGGRLVAGAAARHPPGLPPARYRVAHRAATAGPLSGAVPESRGDAALDAAPTRKTRGPRGARGAPAGPETGRRGALDRRRDPLPRHARRRPDPRGAGASPHALPLAARQSRGGARGVRALPPAAGVTARTTAVGRRPIEVSRSSGTARRAAGNDKGTPKCPLARAPR